MACARNLGSSSSKGSQIANLLHGALSTLSHARMLPMLPLHGHERRRPGPWEALSHTGCYKGENEACRKAQQSPMAHLPVESKLGLAHPSFRPASFDPINEAGTE